MQEGNILDSIYLGGVGMEGSVAVAKDKDDLFGKCEDRYKNSLM
jgi:hypothetical protein